MITLLALTLLTWGLFYLLVFSENPLVMALILTVTAVTGLSLTSMSQTSSWYPLILAMLFLGGILVTFIILCSLMPNQSVTNKKITVFWVAISFAALCCSPFQTVFKSNNVFIEEGPSFFLTLGLILLYFFSFVMLVANQSHPIRTLWCPLLSVL